MQCHAMHCELALKGLGRQAATETGWVQQEELATGGEKVNLGTGAQLRGERGNEYWHKH